MRIRKDFERPEGKKSARLVVIAAEGKDTERIYFEAMKEALCASSVHVEVLERGSDKSELGENESSPEHVYRQIREFKSQYNIEDDDQLWIVVDRDKWTSKMLASVAQYCEKDSNLYFCLSNPCFELWLLLHLEDVAAYNDKQQQQLYENKRTRQHGPTWTEKCLRNLMESYSKSDYDAKKLLKNIDEAIERARKLDIEPKSRWPNYIGTRVYRLANSIMSEV